MRDAPARSKDAKYGDLRTVLNDCFQHVAVVIKFCTAKSYVPLHSDEYSFWNVIRFKRADEALNSLAEAR